MTPARATATSAAAGSIQQVQKGVWHISGSVVRGGTWVKGSGRECRAVLVLGLVGLFAIARQWSSAAVCSESEGTRQWRAK